MPDKDIAAFLAGVKMTERLDTAHGRGNCRARAPVPKPTAALSSSGGGVGDAAGCRGRRLRHPNPSRSTALRGRAAAGAGRDARQYALNYSATLPDFICLQTRAATATAIINRIPKAHGQLTTDWSKSLPTSISRKSTEAVSHNDTSLYGKSAEAMGGALSRGDFGSILKEIFVPETDAEFHWERGETSMAT